MRFPLLSSLALGIALVSTATAQDLYFTANLDGDQENPPVATSARGFGVVRLTLPNSVDIVVFGEGLSASAAHLHQAAVGSNGGVIVGLTSTGNGEFRGSATLSAAQSLALQNGNTYFNMHTAANPGGEIRGQVVTPTTTRISALLNGSQENPPVVTSATGEGIAFLHEPTNRIVYTVELSNIANVQAAHIHLGNAGSNGPVLEGLNGGPTSYCGVTRRLTASELATANSDGLYFNVHTTANPGGEIRGQMLVNVGDFAFPLDGGQENPPVATSAFGHGSITINADNSVSYKVVTNGLSATRAHIHGGVVGSNGPVLVALAGGPTVYSGTTAPLPSADLMIGRSGGWYVNVHTGANPGGEIRGQVLVADLPTVYGAACALNSGRRPQMGATGIPATVDEDYQIRVFGADPNSASFLSIGLNRVSAAGLPLPFHLAAGGFGPAGCYVFNSPDSVLFTPVNSQGCAQTALTIPFDTSFIGLQVFSQYLFLDGGALKTSDAIALTVQ